MARVTVEDCIDKLPNRFELVLLAAHRARSISQGSQITVERDNDKNPVVALREIAEEKVLPEDKNALIIAYCGNPRCTAYQAAATAAQKLGYKNVKHMSAGIAGWNKAGEKVEKAN